MIDLQTTLAKLDIEARTVREYAQSDCSRAISRYLQSLFDVYKEELVDAPAEDVPAIQARARQLAALKSLVDGAPHASARL